MQTLAINLRLIELSLEKENNLGHNSTSSEVLHRGRATQLTTLTQTIHRFRGVGT